MGENTGLLRPRVYYSARPKVSRLHAADAAYSSVCDPDQALGF